MRGWKEQWRRFAAEAPGSRFRARHDRLRSERGRRAWWRRALNVAVALACLAIGLVLAVAPGPAVLFFLIAGLILAKESRAAADLLDRADVRVAPLVNVVNRRWCRLSPQMRRAATVGMVLGSVFSIAAGILVLK